MADRIKGITIEIGGDTTKLSKALEGVNKDLKTAQSGLKDVDSLLKLDPGNIELLRQKQGYLNDTIDGTKEKLEQEKAALEQMKNTEGFDKNSEQAKALERQIAADEQALKKLQDQAKEFGSVGAQQFKNAAKEIQEVGDKVKGVGDKIGSIGGTMSTKVTAPIVGFGAASLAAFSEVDKGSDVIIAKTGATGEAFEEMNDIMKSIASYLPMDFETIGTAVGEVNTRFGETGEGLEQLSRYFLKFAEVNGTDVNNSIDKTQKALTAFGLGSEYAMDVLDVFNKVGQNTGISMDTLMAGLTTNAAVFNELGLDISQAAAFMGQLEVSGADAGTVLGSLQKAMKNATADGKPLNDALAELQDSIKNGTGEVDGLTAAYDLFGKSGAQVYEAVRNGSIDFANMAAGVEEWEYSVSDAYVGMLDPMDEFAQTSNILKIAAAEFGDVLQTALVPILIKAQEVIQSLTEKFKALTPEQQQNIIKFGAIAAAIGPVLVFVGKLVTGIGSIIKIGGALVSGIGSIVGILGGPLTLAIGAAIAIGVLLWKNWDKIKEVAINVATKVAEAFEKLKTAVSEKFEAMKTAVSEKFTAIKTGITTTVDNIKTAVSEKFEAIKTAVSTKVEAIKTGITNKFTAIKTSVTTTVDNIKTAVSDKFTAIKNGITEKINAAKDAVKSAIDKIKGFFDFKWELPKIKLPHFSLSGEFSLMPPSVPKLSVDWYKKAYTDPVMFTRPTVMPTAAGMKGFGDGAGAEVVLGLNKLREMVGGGSNVNINVYGAQGQDVKALAVEVERRLVMAQKSQQAVFG